MGHDALGAQSAVCSGGRYDGLFEQLGGKPTPGCGFGIGAERVLLLLQDAGRTVDAAPLAYVVHRGGRGKSAGAPHRRRRCAATATPSSCMPAAAASSRR